MKKKIGLSLLALLVLLLGYAGMQNPEYTVSREIAIQAKAEMIFPYLESVKLGEKWGPWTEIDPDSKMTYSGPDKGVGARASWTGGKQMGTGSATVAAVVPNQSVSIKLEYIEPMPMQQDSEYLVRTEGDHTVVTWKVSGKKEFISRVMCLFFNMDKHVGGMFEKGLSNLKRLVESSSH